MPGKQKPSQTTRNDDKKFVIKSNVPKTEESNDTTKIQISNEDEDNDKTEKKMSWIRKNAYGLEDFKGNGADEDEENELRYRNISKEDLDKQEILEGEMVRDLSSANDASAILEEGANGTSVFKHCILLRAGDKEYVVGPVEQRYKLFDYKLSVIRTKYSAYRNTYYKVIEIKDMSRKKITLELLKHIMFTMIGMQSVEFETMMSSGPWTKDKKYNSLKDKSKYVFTSSQVMEAITKTPYLRDFKDNSECKRYFLNDIIDFVCMYYESVMICSMTWENIENLYNTLKSNPVVLCFTKTIKFYWFAYGRTSGKTWKSNRSAGVCKLPELTYDVFQSISSTNNLAIDPSDKLCVFIYQMVKDEKYKNGHLYIAGGEIKTRVTFMSGNAQRALNWLVKQKILFQSKDRYYLYNTFRDEITIAYCIEELYKRKIARITADMIDDDDEYYSDQLTRKSQEEDRKNSDNVECNIAYLSPEYKAEFKARMEEQKRGMCSEQLRLLAYHLSKPVVLVSGKGGSGKTSALCKIMKMYDKSEVMAVAFQNNHVVLLNEAIGGQCFTGHSVLYNHDITCHKSPYKKDNSNTRVLTDDGTHAYESKLGIVYTDCILEKIRIFICDETSLMYEELFSKLLCALIHCSKVESVIMTGDIYQTRQINPGDLIGGLKIALNKMGCFLEFKHNHRVKPNSELIDKNLEAIKNMEPEKIVFDPECFHLIELEEKTNIDEIATTLLKELGKRKWKRESFHQITRTNEVRKMLMYVSDVYYGMITQTPYETVKNMDVGKKISFKVTDVESNIHANEILYLVDIKDVDTQQIGATNCTFIPKDKIKGRLMNGYTRKITVRSVGSQHVREIKLTRQHISKVVNSDATTVHMFQGFQIEWVVYVIPYDSEYETMNIIYTALGRSTDGVVIVSNKDTFFNAVKRPQPPRRTFLHERILYYCKKYQNEVNSLPLENEIRELEEMEEAMKLEIEQMKQNEIQEAKRAKRELLEARKKEGLGVLWLCKDVWLEILLQLAVPDGISTIYTVRTLSKSMRELCTENRLWKNIYEKYIAPIGLNIVHDTSYFVLFKRHRGLLKWWTCGGCSKYISNVDMILSNRASGLIEIVSDSILKNPNLLPGAYTSDSKGRFKDIEYPVKFMCDCKFKSNCNVSLRAKWSGNTKKTDNIDLEITGAYITKSVAMDWSTHFLRTLQMPSNYTKPRVALSITDTITQTPVKPGLKGMKLSDLKKMMQQFNSS